MNREPIDASKRLVKGPRKSPSVIRRGVAPSNGLVSRQAQTSRSAKITPHPLAQLDVSQLPTIPSTQGDGAPSFLDNFGPYGIATVFVAIICVVWTVFLIVLTANPNAMANYLMNTAEFDNGTFWLIIDPELTLVAFSVLALGTIALIYLSVLLHMLHGGKISNKLNKSPLERARTATQARFSSIELTNRHILRHWDNFARFQKQNRKHRVRIGHLVFEFHFELTSILVLCARICG